MRLYLIFILALAVFTKSTAIENRIIGGQNSNAGQFPSTVAVNVQTSDSKFFCGGALYNTNWVITAGHCVYNGILFTIHVGSHTLEESDVNRETLSTSDYVLHPDFDPNTIQNDIGLIKFRRPIYYSMYIQPTYLPYDELVDDDTAISVGWGQTSDRDAGLSDTLQYTEITILSNAECKLTYGNQIVDNMVCIEGNYNEGTCTGDNGSPLYQHYLYNFYITVGISSFISGNGCESTDPSGYTRVYPYANWIRNVTET